MFVANRVSEIRNLTSPNQWRHIVGILNPADMITRGQLPEDLSKGAWFHGPEFFSSYKSQWTSNDEVPNVASDDPEIKKCRNEVCLQTQSDRTEQS